MYYAKHYNFASVFKEYAEEPVRDLNLDGRGLLAAGYDDEDIGRPQRPGHFWRGRFGQVGIARFFIVVRRRKRRGLIS